jgi:hypothetical protein
MSITADEGLRMRFRLTSRSDILRKCTTAAASSATTADSEMGSCAGESPGEIKQQACSEERKAGWISGGEVDLDKRKW